MIEDLAKWFSEEEEKNRRRGELQAKKKPYEELLRKMRNSSFYHTEYGIFIENKEEYQGMFQRMITYHGRSYGHSQQGIDEIEKIYTKYRDEAEMYQRYHQTMGRVIDDLEKKIQEIQAQINAI